MWQKMKKNYDCIVINLLRYIDTNKKNQSAEACNVKNIKIEIH